MRNSAFRSPLKTNFVVLLFLIYVKVIKVNISGALEHYPELLGKYVKVGKIFHIMYG